MITMLGFCAGRSRPLSAPVSKPVTMPASRAHAAASRGGRAPPSCRGLRQGGRGHVPQCCRGPAIGAQGPCPSGPRRHGAPSTAAAYSPAGLLFTGVHLQDTSAPRSRGAGSLTHGKPARSALVSTAQLPFFSISTAVTSVEMAAGTALCVRVAAASKAAAWITAKQHVGPHQAPRLTSAPLHAPAGSAAHPNTQAVSSAPASPLKLPVPCFSEA